MSTIAEYRVRTSSGEVSLWDSQGEGPIAFFVHGNSLCKEIFKKQFEDTVLTSQLRLMALDLPGHGSSEKAINPQKTYSLEGYAHVVVEVLEKLKINNATFIGHSMGGHVVIILLEKWPGTQGILLSGTPPIPASPEGFQKGFHPYSRLNFHKEVFDQEEAELFISESGIKKAQAPFLVNAVLKTDGIARTLLLSSVLKGVGGNQKEVVENSKKPAAMVAGQQDPLVNYEYVEKEVNPRAFWKSKIHYIKGGHATFWENPQEMNKIILLFLSDLNSGK
jgi:pimeloyl-ACP methyl ester carboxylesterase